MDIRIHSFKVYRIMTISGMKYWTFRYPEEWKSYGDIVLNEMTLWELLDRCGKDEKDVPEAVRKDFEKLSADASKRFAALCEQGMAAVRARDNALLRDAAAAPATQRCGPPRAARRPDNRRRRSPRPPRGTRQRW